jgi:hypothetical protein
MRFGTLNVRCLYRAGLLVTVSAELSKYQFFSNRTQINKNKKQKRCYIPFPL